jgi:hypothetical protein
MKYSDYLQNLLDFPLTKAQKKAFDDFYEKQMTISEQIVLAGRKAIKRKPIQRVDGIELIGTEITEIIIDDSKIPDQDAIIIDVPKKDK